MALKLKGEDRLMTYMDKEGELVKAVVASGGAPMFDSKEEALEFIGDTLKAFPNYVNTVVAYNVKIPLIYARYDGEELRDRVVRLDTERHNAHEVAIGAVNIMNRVCEKMGLPPFAEVDTTNRAAVADFAGRFVNETYRGDRGGDMDSVAQLREEYDANRTHEHLSRAAMAAEIYGLGDGPEGTDGPEDPQASL